jgi:hypothetical protein
LGPCGKGASSAPRRAPSTVHAPRTANGSAKPAPAYARRVLHWQRASIQKRVPIEETDVLARPEFVSLYELVTRRIRAANTMFGNNVKLVLRQLDAEHWALLPLPYLLVVPTVTRPEVTRPQAEDFDTIVVPRSVTLIAQLDGRGSEAEHAAAADIELAERQLIFALVNWRPTECYKATIYAGMRLAGSRLPDVKTSFVFIFPEEIGLPDEEVGLGELEPNFVVNVNAGCCPPDEVVAGEVPPICVTPNRRI